MNASPAPTTQGTLWATDAFREDSPTLRTGPEYLGAIEHLEYAVFRRYQNHLTRAERAKLDNTIENTIFKIDRYLIRRDDAESRREDEEFQGV